MWFWLGTMAAKLASKFPLHECVLRNDLVTLKSLLQSNKHDVNMIDPQGQSMFLAPLSRVLCSSAYVSMHIARQYS